MKQVHIVSTGSYLPGDPLTNADLERWIGAVSPDLLAQVRIDQRHWLVDPATGAHRETNSAMAAKAIQSALEPAGLAPADIDLLILSTSSPDYPLPPTVALVQDKLGLSRCATLELRSGAAGSVAALDMARLYLERGVYSTAVVVGSEAISPLLVPTLQNPKALRVRDRLGMYSFGDGAGAMVLRTEAQAGGIFSSGMASVGGGRKPGMTIPVGGTSTPLTQQSAEMGAMPLRVDFTGSAQYTPHLLTEALNEILHHSGLRAEDIDICVLPTNVDLLQTELSQAGLQTPEWHALDGKLVENLRFVGSTGSAALPLALDHAWRRGQIQPGQRVLLLAYEISKWIYAGLVLTWSAVPPKTTTTLTGTEPLAALPI